MLPDSFSILDSDLLTSVLTPWLLREVVYIKSTEYDEPASAEREATTPSPVSFLLLRRLRTRVNQTVSLPRSCFRWWSIGLLRYTHALHLHPHPSTIPPTHTCHHCSAAWHPASPGFPGFPGFLGFPGFCSGLAAVASQAAPPLALGSFIFCTSASFADWSWFSHWFCFFTCVTRPFPWQHCYWYFIDWFIPDFEPPPVGFDLLNTVYEVMNVYFPIVCPVCLSYVCLACSQN